MQNKRTRRSNGNQGTGIIQKHIMNNLKNYIIITIIFLVGVSLGVLFINNASVEKGEEISSYINNFLEKTKENASIDYIKLFMSSVKTNISLAILLWFAGLTVIGVVALYGIICFRGFLLGYTVSSIIATIGMQKGSVFILSSMLLQNVIFIPCIFAITISRNKTI